MKAIIFSHLFNRGEEVFKNSEIIFIICSERNEKKFLALQKKHQTFIVILDSRPLSQAFFENLLPQTLIIRFGVGISNIPIKLCQDLGHRVANTPKTSTISVSEYVIAQMINLSRQFFKVHDDFKKRDWNRFVGKEINKKTLAILGMGNTGQELAKRAKLGFEMNIIAMGKSYQEKNVYVDKQVNNLKEAVCDADFVSIHFSLEPSNEKIINAKTLNFFKKTAFLINTSRGQHIDEKDLFTSLLNKEIAGAALDVFSHEPYPNLQGKYDLRDLDNLILTPHIASNTKEANQKTAEKIVEIILNFYKKLIKF